VKEKCGKKLSFSERKKEGGAKKFAANEKDEKEKLQTFKRS